MVYNKNMNVLVINGSPKGEKSNTYRLTQAFVEGLKIQEEKSGNTSPSIEILEIYKLNIRPCLGCFACWNKTPGKCCVHDDMSMVIEKFMWADLTIWSFPLYYFNVPGQLKNMIDRQLPFALPFMDNEAESGGHEARYDMSKKRNVVISTCGFYTAKGNYDGVTAMFDHFCGKDGYTPIFCGQGELFRVEELSGRTGEYLSYVKQAGSEYAAGVISNETRQKLDEDLYDRDVFERMADASWGVTKDGKKEDESLTFTRQMVIFYNKEKWPGHDIVLEMNYTDIGKAYRVILGKDGPKVTDDFSGKFTTQINTPFSVWQSISRGEIAGDEAMMKHLYSVEGDFDLMMHWDEYFSAGRSASNQKTESKTQSKTNMTLLLIPWIFFWIAAGINSVTGSFLSIVAAALMPVIMCKTRATIYDKLSVLFVGICSIALIAKMSPIFIMPLSYLLFGLMWFISCFTKIPLTAHYSQNDYNGAAALKNPLFIKTNRILTAAWGVLYILTPIWTYFIMKTSVAGFIGAINSVIPALMGIFTGWFQKWYPGHVAKGK